MRNAPFAEGKHPAPLHRSLPVFLATVRQRPFARSFRRGKLCDHLQCYAAERLRRALMEPEQVIIHRDPREITAKVMIEGTASGILMGGNLNVIGRGVGWACPSFAGSILLIEAIDTYIGQIDATLTQLRRAGCLDGLKGVAVGQFIRSAEPKPGKWSVIDVLYGQLGEL